MANRRFLGFSNGVARWWEYDPVTDESTEIAVQDVTPLVEASRALQNDPEHWQKGVKKEFAQYAHVPNIILERWVNNGVDINNVDALFAMVNRPEYAYLKTTTKVVLARD